MRHSEKNQLFIDSIHHWIVDGIERFQAGSRPTSTEGILYWSAGKQEFKLNGIYCPLCVNFGDDCNECFLQSKGYQNGIECIQEYKDFISRPNINTVNTVIEALWNASQDTTSKNFKDKYYSEGIIKKLKKGILPVY